MNFISQDKQFVVTISQECIDSIVEHIKKAAVYETGGILIGAYSDDLGTAAISQITGPTIDSKGGFTWFNRGIKGLKELLKRYWDVKLYYLGEWHFHPNAKPIPSNQDKKQMREIARSNQYRCPEPIMIIVGGNWQCYEISVFIQTLTGESYELKAVDLNIGEM
ncbi:Mov34/MPN/PAD-1 family protein [Arachidicoccus sp.]|uniref:Mov34/MPN/PAD-1 family protein n=1 Tax=Arachidicoccus sp. TaxID=1872624 RepID=UPI003D23E76D